MDGANSASTTLDWLTAHGYDALVANAITVVNATRRPADINIDLRPATTDAYLELARALSGP